MHVGEGVRVRDWHWLNAVYAKCRRIRCECSWILFFKIYVLACSLCCSCHFFAEMCVHAPARAQLGPFKDFTKERAMKLSASERDGYCAMAGTFDDQTKTALQRCFPELVGIIKGMCPEGSGTAYYTRT